MITPWRDHGIAGLIYGLPGIHVVIAEPDE
jgi:hypothetical protein